MKLTGLGIAVLLLAIAVGNGLVTFAIGLAFGMMAQLAWVFLSLPAIMFLGMWLGFESAK